MGHPARVPDTEGGPGYERALAWAAVAYVGCHHLGSVPAGIGPAGGGTRWTDWIDLAVPFLVLVPVLLTLRAAPASAGGWLLFAAGAVTYVEGHGLHLAANSIGNEHPSDLAHLWDERVGHLLWYAGVALVMAAVVTTLHDRARPVRPGAHLLALAVGLTWATNAVGGGLRVPALVLALGGAGYGFLRRASCTCLLLPAGLGAAGLLIVDLSLH